MLPNGVLSRIWRCRHGGIAIIFALTAVPLILASAAAVDISRMLIVRARLGYALDAAGLAVGSSEGSQEQLQNVMQTFFDANYPEEELGIPATPIMEIDGNIIRLSAQADVDTTLLQIIGIDKFTVNANNEIVRETTGLEVVLVLDNTGSMFGSKLSALKGASEDLVDILFGQEEVAEKLFVGVVPFASTVNVGTGNAKGSNVINTFNENDFDPDFWRGCVMARDFPHDTRDSSITRGGKWDVFFWPSTRGLSSDTNNWPSISGTRGQRRGPNKNCPIEIQPLTNVKADVLATLDDMEARGTTHINLGAIWGFRVLSPKKPFRQGLPYDEPNFDKAAIIMTDGDNFISSDPFSISAYGALQDGVLGTTSKSAAEDELDDRLTIVCNRMKNREILIYTITFQVSSSSTRNLMENCATSPNQYFDSPST